MPMPKSFQAFMSQLRETNVTLKDYVDFPKVEANVDRISMKLHQLNYLIGQADMAAAVKNLWRENHTVFSVLGILIAIRDKDKKKAINHIGETRLLTSYFSSPEDVIIFLDETGLTRIFQTRQVKNLVDYVFGIEVGLDSNARKNRGGHIMESIVSNILTENSIFFRKEIYCTEFPLIKYALGTDKKRFDFVIPHGTTTYLVEVNFYSGGGSKLNEVARAYTELAPQINSVPGYEFVWITDGIGWKSASNKLQEAFTVIPHIYLTDINDFISILKS